MTMKSTIAARPLSAVHLKTKRLKGFSEGIRIHQFQRVLACALRQTSIWQYCNVLIKSCRVMVLHRKTKPMIMSVERRKTPQGSDRTRFDILRISGSHCGAAKIAWYIAKRLNDMLHELWFTLLFISAIYVGISVSKTSRQWEFVSTFRALRHSTLNDRGAS